MSSDALNPIFEYAGNGQRHEKKGDWKKAVHWYQRALACLPNLYGTYKELWPGQHAGATPVSFAPRHAAGIYAALGRCLNALERRADSFLAVRAAHCLDPGNISIQRFMHAHSNAANTTGSESPAPERVDGPGLIGTPMDLAKSLTLVMVTHCTDRLKKFQALAPPSSGLVTATYGSIVNVFGEDICACPRILCYDHNPVPSVRNTRYAGALERFAREQGFELHTFPGIGLFNVLVRTVPLITTPYTFFVEHDWLFRGDAIRLDILVEMMNQNLNLHSVRFNKRQNHIDGHDFIMQVEASQKGYALLHTSSYSNNPSIIRTEKLRNEWLPSCGRALQLVSGKLGGSAFGIEEILFKSHVEDIRTKGFIQAHAAWGACVFGSAGAPPRLVHLGE